MALSNPKMFRSPKEWRRNPIGATVCGGNLALSTWGTGATPIFNIRARLAWRGTSNFATGRRMRSSCIRTYWRTGDSIDPTRDAGGRGGYRRRPSTRGPMDTRFRMPDRGLCAVEFDDQIRRSLAEHPAGEHRRRAGTDRPRPMVAGCPSIRMEAH